MIITRTNPISRQTVSAEINITQEELDRINAGESIQRVVPHLSADAREFIISGLLPGEWDTLFSDK